jgi:hypothetical protein
MTINSVTLLSRCVSTPDLCPLWLKVGDQGKNPSMKVKVMYSVEKQ